MELLKSAIKLALLQQSVGVRLAVGKPIQFRQEDGSWQPNHAAGVPSFEALSALADFLFPGKPGILRSSEVHQGTLNIAKLGQVQVLCCATESEPWIGLYMPPHGAGLAREEFTEASRRPATSSPIFPVATPPPPAPVAPPPSKSSPEVGGDLDVLRMTQPPAMLADYELSPSAALAYEGSPELQDVPSYLGGGDGGALHTPSGVILGETSPPMSFQFKPASTSDLLGLPMDMADTNPGAARALSDTGLGLPSFASAPSGSLPDPARELSFEVPNRPSMSPNFPPPPASMQPMPPNFPPPPASMPSIPEAEHAADHAAEHEADPKGPHAIDSILERMIKQKASDLHLTVGQEMIFRVDGAITRLGGDKLDASAMQRLVMAILPSRNRREFEKDNDTDFAYELNGVGRFRVNVFRDINGIGSVMRHIPQKIPTAQQLGLPPAIMQFCTLHKGLVLVTGPTGSGKSTTLAAMIDHINRTRSDHILTVEDPVEFVHPNQKCLVNQREVGKHTKSFARALKAALREDPDVVLIGEMRDLETIAIAIETAETGHLVFGTLHTTTAISTVDRIVDQFPSDRQEQIRMMLSSSLKGVVAQTLLKKIGGGRCAAQEILVTNDAVAALIREGKNHMIGNHMQSQQKEGNQLLNQALIDLVDTKQVAAQDAFMKAIDRKGFAELLKRRNIALPTPAEGAA